MGVEEGELLKLADIVQGLSFNSPPLRSLGELAEDLKRLGMDVIGAELIIEEVGPGMADNNFVLHRSGNEIMQASIDESAWLYRLEWKSHITIEKFIEGVRDCVGDFEVSSVRAPRGSRYPKLLVLVEQDWQEFDATNRDDLSAAANQIKSGYGRVRFKHPFGSFDYTPGSPAQLMLVIGCSTREVDRYLRFIEQTSGGAIQPHESELLVGRIFAMVENLQFHYWDKPPRIRSPYISLREFV